MTKLGGSGHSALLLAALLSAACTEKLTLEHPVGGAGGGGGITGMDARPSGGGNGSIDSGGSDAKGPHCAGGAQSFSLNVQAELPAIMFALDRSPSMAKPLGSGTRFSVTREALIDTMSNYPSLAQFGYVEFPNDKNCTAGCCAGGFVPLVQSDMGAPASIVTQLNQCSQNQSIACSSNDATPTAVALRKIAQASSPGGPIEVILLTDGAPTCSDPLLPGGADPCGQAVQEISDMATGRAASTRIRTFVLGVGDVMLDTQMLPYNECLSMMAGVGQHPNGSSSPPFYYVANTESLVRSTVDSIVASLICHLDITDQSPFDQSPGHMEVDVTLNQTSNQIPNDLSNGWTLAAGGTRLDFTGSGCNSLIAGLLKGIAHHVTVKACPADAHATPFQQPNP